MRTPEILEETLTNYTELGTLTELGKHSHIAQLDRMGFHVPPTLVLGSDLKDEDREVFDSWLEVHRGDDIQLRTDGEIGRNSFSNREVEEPNTLWGHIKQLKDFRSVIIQSGPKNGINKDYISMNIRVTKDPITLKPTVTAYVAPDIASLMNRGNLTPFWEFSFYDNESYIDIPNRKDNFQGRESYWKHVLYRIGRDDAKRHELGLFPKVEDIDPQDKNYEKVAKMGEIALKLYPDMYPAPCYWYEMIKERGIDDIRLSLKEREYITNEMKKVRNIAKHLPYYSAIFKMSIICHNGVSIPTYWDIITIPNDIIRYED